MTNTPMDITPDVAPLGPLSGKYDDDDPRYIDEAFEAADASPQTYYGVPTDREDLPRPTRTLTRAFTLTGTDAPILFFPADLKRKNFTIRGSGIAYMWGSDANELAGFGRLNSGVTAFVTNTAALVIPDHTGPIYVITDPAGGPGTVVVSVVTE